MLLFEKIVAVVGVCDVCFESIVIEVIVIVERVLLVSYLLEGLADKEEEHRSEDVLLTSLHQTVSSSQQEAVGLEGTSRGNT